MITYIYVGRAKERIIILFLCVSPRTMDHGDEFLCEQLSPILVSLPNFQFDEGLEDWAEYHRLDGRALACARADAGYR